MDYCYFSVRQRLKVIYPAKFRHRKLLFLQGCAPHSAWLVGTSLLPCSDLSNWGQEFGKISTLKPLTGFVVVKKTEQCSQKTEISRTGDINDTRRDHTEETTQTTGAQRRRIQLKEGKDVKVYMEYLWPKNHHPRETELQDSIDRIILQLLISIFFFIHITPVQTNWR